MVQVFDFIDETVLSLHDSGWDIEILEKIMYTNNLVENYGASHQEVFWLIAPQKFITLPILMQKDEDLGH